ncbi:MAG: RIP metalloprotease RseP, partial [Hyphomicrobiaceae bacterium]|nr:RIP metalloprotease RseP [Hyphomicrobiaceae bacterium]
RWRGLVVEKFAIWFGKPLWSKTVNGVEYRLGTIPAGGYVAIPQMAPMEAVEGKSEHGSQELPPIRPIDKIIVAFAGPLFSFLLAFAFAVLVWVIGRPMSEPESTTIIGYVVPDGPADRAHLKVGDEILSVNGTPVKRFAGMGRATESITWNIARSETPEIPITFERNGKTFTVQVSPARRPQNGWGRKRLPQIGILPAITPKIARIIPDSPAAKAGLRSGDLILTANGTSVRSLQALPEMLKKTKQQPVALTIRRKGHVFETLVVPQFEQTTQSYKVGILWDFDGVTQLVHPNPITQLVVGVTTIWDTLVAVASPKSDIKLEHLSGPVGIMRLYYMLFEASDGWRRVLWFSVILNVNLALMNLLPIPVLDGGHITLAIVEGIMRRPVNIRLLEIVQNGFALLIIGFILYVSFYDVIDLPWKGGPEIPEMKFTPSPNPPTSPGTTS